MVPLSSAARRRGAHWGSPRQRTHGSLGGERPPRAAQPSTRCCATTSVTSEGPHRNTMSIKSPSNDDWIRYVPEIHPSGLRQFGGPNNTGDAWRHGAYKGETSASNPLRRHVATATNVSTRRDANLDRAWKGCGKSKRDDLISNGFDVGPATVQPVVEGFGGTNWGAHGRAMSPSVGERPRLEGETHRIPKL